MFRDIEIVYWAALNSDEEIRRAIEESSRQIKEK